MTRLDKKEIVFDFLIEEFEEEFMWRVIGEIERMFKSGEVDLSIDEKGNIHIHDGGRISMIIGSIQRHVDWMCQERFGDARSFRMLSTILRQQADRIDEAALKMKEEFD